MTIYQFNCLFETFFNALFQQLTETERLASRVAVSIHTVISIIF